MRRILAFFIFVSAAMVFAAGVQEKKLSPQSQKIRGAIDAMTSAESAFLDAFPKSKAEFIKICHSAKFDELYDCHELFHPHVEKLLISQPSRMGKILAGVASTLSYDADGPNYLQHLWSGFCISNTKEFVASIEAIEAGDLALKYLNEFLHHPDNQKIEPCISALHENGFSNWAVRAKKFLHKSKSVDK